MKKFLAIMVLGLLLSSNAYTDDIKDFQIEGMSVGDSLLDYIDKSEIIKKITPDYPNSKKFGRFFKKFPNSIYEVTQLHIKVNDPKYIIYSISGAIFFSNNMKACNDKRKEISKEMTKVISGKVIDIGSNKHIDREGDVRNVTYTQYIEVNGGFVDFVCTAWTKKYENNTDSLKVIITTTEFDEWLHKEAF